MRISHGTLKQERVDLVAYQALKKQAVDAANPALTADKAELNDDDKLNQSNGDTSEYSANADLLFVCSCALSKLALEATSDSRSSCTHLGSPGKIL